MSIAAVLLTLAAAGLSPATAATVPGVQSDWDKDAMYWDTRTAGGLTGADLARFADQETAVVARLGGVDGVQLPYYRRVSWGQPMPQVGSDTPGIGAFSGQLHFTSADGFGPSGHLESGPVSVTFAVYPATVSNPSIPNPVIAEGAQPLASYDVEFDYVAGPAVLTVSSERPVVAPGEHVLLSIQHVPTDASGYHISIQNPRTRESVKIGDAYTTPRLPRLSTAYAYMPAGWPVGDYEVTLVSYDDSSWVGPATVRAGEALDSDGVSVTADVTETDGPLTMTVAANSLELGLQTVTFDRRVFTGDLPAVTVTDQRAIAGGWEVSTQVAAFTAGDSEFSAAHLGWQPRIVDGQEGIVLGSTIVGALDGGPGLAGAATLARAIGDSRLGAATLGASLTLGVPIDTEPGSYSALATVSLFPVD